MRQFQYKKFDTVFFHESVGPKSFGLNYFCVEFESFKTISWQFFCMQKNCTDSRSVHAIGESDSAASPIHLSQTQSFIHTVQSVQYM